MNTLLVESFVKELANFALDGSVSVRGRFRRGFVGRRCGRSIGGNQGGNVRRGGGRVLSDLIDDIRDVVFGHIVCSNTEFTEVYQCVDQC